MSLDQENKGRGVIIALSGADKSKSLNDLPDNHLSLMIEDSINW